MTVSKLNIWCPGEQFAGAPDVCKRSDSAAFVTKRHLPTAWEPAAGVG